MIHSVNRRQFVHNTIQAGAAIGLGELAFLNGLPAVSAAEANLQNERVRFSPDVEPLVRLLEDTDRSQVLEAVARKIKDGTSYGQLLTGLLLAGVRGIQPRPVGFKFHAVLVVNSAHLASLHSPDRDRWLPLFWAIDNYKNSQARNKQEGDWVMPPVKDASLPASHQAKSRFVEAMENWDEEGADAAVAALGRTAGAEEVIELFWRFGARDFRDIGHKAIFVANSWRTLQTIGWRHSEAVLRSLAYALLEHEGTNPRDRDADADRPWRENLKRAASIRDHWTEGKRSPEAATDLLAALRTTIHSEACDRVVAQLNAGVSPASIWDALFLRAGELLMQQPGIVGLHCVTSVNALHYGYTSSHNDETRRMQMLQAAAFLAMFSKTMKSRGKVQEDLRIDKLEKATVEGVEDIFATVSKDRMGAAKKTLAFLDDAKNPHAAEGLLAAARRLLFLKGTDSHDYKFSEAALEDFYHCSPALRPRLLATSMFHLRGAGDKDSGLVGRTRAAVGA